MRHRLAVVCTLVGGLLLFTVAYALVRTYLDGLAAATALDDFPVLDRRRLTVALILGGAFVTLGLGLRRGR